MKTSKKRSNAEYSDLYKYLRHEGRRQKRGNTKDKRGVIKGRVGIEERPSVVEERADRRY